MGQKTTILAVGLIVFTVILALLFVISRVVGIGGKKEVKTPTTQTTVSRDLVPVNELVTEPMVYNGYTVEADSDITSWATNRSFFFTATVGGGFTGGQRRSLLIISDKAFNLPQDPNDDKLGLGEKAKVTAKGKIEILDKTQLQSALGINLEDPKAVLFDDRIKNWNVGPVMVLDSVTVDSTTTK